MRCLFGFMCVLALGVMACSETSGTGGNGGAAGDGGNGGTAGYGGSGGATGQEFACNEQGIRDAIAEGGGPHTFGCDGPTTVVTDAEIVIDKDVVLHGEDDLTVSGGFRLDDAAGSAVGHRVFHVERRVTATLDGIAITQGYASGGGVLNEGDLVLDSCSIHGNAGDVGGGIWNGGGVGAIGAGTLTLLQSTVSGNTAETRGGGIRNEGVLTLLNSEVSGNKARSGGGIENVGNGTLTLTNSTVSGNIADSGGGIENNGRATLTNSTVSGNMAGIAAAIASVWELALTSSTVSGNTTEGGADIRVFGTDAVLTAANSLIDGDCGGFPQGTPPDIIASNGYNIESPGDTCGFGQPTDQVNVSANGLKLGPLQDNGGPTETHALGEDSVAIDVIPQAECEVETDQRGEPRPAGDGCDLGALEVQP